MINLKNCIISLQCSWIKRVTQHWSDTWRYDLKLACYGNVLLADKNTFIQAEHPVMYNICSSFGMFKNEFFKINNNFEKAHIFKNPMFKRGINDNGILCENFFGRNLEFSEYGKIAKLRFEDFFDRGRAKLLEVLNEEYDVNFSLVTYMRVHGALQFYKNKIGVTEPAPEQSLEFFLRSFKKGSKPFRRILEYREFSGLKIAELNLVTTFVTITGCERPNTTILRKCWGEWNNSFLPNIIREFLYKFRSNSLGLNSRVQHFVPNHDSRCTLCLTANQHNGPFEQETFLHVFFTCPVTSTYRNAIIEELFPEILPCTEQIKKQFWFFGEWHDNTYNSLVGSTVSLVNFAIWKMKLKKELYPVSSFKGEICSGIFKIIKLSSKIRDAKNAANFHICRREFHPP